MLGNCLNFCTIWLLGSHHLLVTQVLAVVLAGEIAPVLTFVLARGHSPRLLWFAI